MDIDALFNDHKSVLAQQLRGEYLAQEGDTIDGFRVIHHAGKGGTGQVYCVYDEKLACKRALKLFCRKEPELRELFFQEMRVIASLNHPNIVQIRSQGEWEGYPYYVMDYLKPLPSNPTSGVVYGWVLSLCDAVHLLNKKNIIHGDIKAENVLWDEDEQQPVIVDFGGSSKRGERNILRGGTPNRDTEGNYLEWETEELLNPTPAYDVLLLARFAQNLLNDADRMSFVWREPLNKALQEVATQRQQTASEFASDLVRAARGGFYRRNRKIIFWLICIFGLLAWVISISRREPIEQSRTKGQDQAQEKIERQKRVKEANLQVYDLYNQKMKDMWEYNEQYNEWNSGEQPASPLPEKWVETAPDGSPTRVHVAPGTSYDASGNHVEE